MSTVQNSCISKVLLYIYIYKYIYMLEGPPCTIHENLRPPPQSPSPQKIKDILHYKATEQVSSQENKNKNIYPYFGMTMWPCKSFKLFGRNKTICSYSGAERP